MSTENIFKDDWWACLQAHLSYVVAHKDRTNEVSLIQVLKKMGVSDEEIEEVRTRTLTALGREDELMAPFDEPPPQIDVPAVEDASQQNVNQQTPSPDEVPDAAMAQPEDVAALAETMEVNAEVTPREEPPVQSRHSPDPPLSQMSLF